ncbi:MAG: HD domain-containing protein [Defluviitaleaceae bacterium]|nr:HD domain-containing protein [Defluviitaleaceae bacterium]
MNNAKVKKASFVVLLFLIVAIASLLLLMLVTDNETYFIGNSHELESFDFSSNIGRIDNDVFDWYPWALHAPEDFLSAPLHQVPAPEEGRHWYGTYRLLVNLTEGVVYGLAGFSADSAMTLWVDGVILVSEGIPGRSLETETPSTGYFSVYFEAGQGLTEIVMQRSSFVHNSRGGFSHFFLAEQQLITEMVSRNYLQNSVLLGVFITSTLIFLGIFITSHKQRYYLWFSLACVMSAIRSLCITRHLVIIFPDISWHAALRIEYVANILLVVCISLFVNAVFEKGPGKVIKALMLGIPLVYLPVVLFTPSHIYTIFRIEHHASFVVVALLLVSSFIVKMIKHPENRRVENFLALFGSLSTTVFTVLEIVLRNTDIRFANINFVLLGMILFVFVSSIALALNFRRSMQELAQAIKEQSLLKNAILTTLAELVEYRDEGTGGHIARTQKYTELLINSMKAKGVYADEISKMDVDLLLQSCQLHDVGKIAVSDLILLKPSKLTEEEFEIIKNHTVFGEQVILRLKEKISDRDFIEYARIFAISHHEKWNGSGYPYGLVGENIPLLGRIMAIGDVYDALVESRPYKKPFSHEKAVEIITEGSGTHFDPSLVELFKEINLDFEKVAAEKL